MANIKKMFARDLIRYTTRGTAALSYPNRREPSVHYKEGRSVAATSHESRPVKPSFCISTLHRDLLTGDTTDNSIDTVLGKLLGYYPNTSTTCFTQTRRSNDPAIRRPRRQRRHKNNHGYKHKQNPSSRPPSTFTVNPATQLLQT